jgi:hypothetical protein
MFFTGGGRIVYHTFIWNNDLMPPHFCCIKNEYLPIVGNKIEKPFFKRKMFGPFCFIAG